MVDNSSQSRRIFDDKEGQRTGFKKAYVETVLAGSTGSRRGSKLLTTGSFNANAFNGSSNVEIVPTKTFAPAEANTLK
jgi:hypothetical protein